VLHAINIGCYPAHRHAGCWEQARRWQEGQQHHDAAGRHAPQQRRGYPHGHHPHHHRTLVSLSIVVPQMGLPC